MGSLWMMKHSVWAVLLVCLAVPALAQFGEDGEASTEVLKCGDPMSLKAKGGNRYWTSNKGFTFAGALTFGYTETFAFICKFKGDGETINFGDTVYIKHVKSGEYLGDGSNAETHSRTITELVNVPAGTRLNSTNEFQIIMPGTAAAYNDRYPVVQGGRIALRNRFARFWVVVLGTTRITSEEFGEGGLPNIALHYASAFCPVDSEEGKECTGHGKCANNRCVCEEDWRGHDCSKKREVGFCHVTGTGHWRTGDNMWYNTGSSGEFIAYSHPDRPHKEAVTVTLGKVKGSNATVVKSVQVRRDHSITKVSAPAGIFLDCDERDVTEGVQASGAGGFKLDSGMIIRSTNGKNQFSIESPSGMEVVVHIFPTSLNVWIHLYEPKDGESRGLCGNFDGDNTNDLESPGQTDSGNVAAKGLTDMYTIKADMSLATCAKNSYANIILEDDNKPNAVLKIGNVEVGDLNEMDLSRALVKQVLADYCGGPAAKASQDAQNTCEKLEKGAATDPLKMADFATCVQEACTTTLSNKEIEDIAVDLYDGDAFMKSDDYRGNVEVIPANQFPAGVAAPEVYRERKAAERDLSGSN